MIRAGDLGVLKADECVWSQVFQADTKNTKGSDIGDLFCPGRNECVGALHALDFRILGTAKCAAFSVLQKLNENTQEAKIKYDAGSRRAS
jgi:hypothetical protein